MKEVTITSVCDNQNHDREVATQEHVGLLNGKPRQIDVCIKCWGDIVLPYLALLEQGVPPETPKPPAKGAVGGQRTGAVHCPACGKEVKSRTGLGAHSRRTHHMTLQNLEAAHGKAERAVASQARA